MSKPAPYRCDVVGSFLRTPAIRDARRKFSVHSITESALRDVEDREIAELFIKEKKAGLKAVTDGEFRRSWWHMDFLWGIGGIAYASGVLQRPRPAGTLWKAFCIGNYLPVLF